MLHSAHISASESLGRMKKSLTRSISYWLLIVVSVASAAVGGWIISDKTATMSAALLDGTATGVDVYVGQPWIVLGAVLVGVGVLGVLLALALTAAKTLVTAAAPVAVEAIDWTAGAEETPTTTIDANAGAVASAEEDAAASAEEEARVDADASTESAVDAADNEDQNGSSGSTATATNNSVR